MLPFVLIGIVVVLLGIAVFVAGRSTRQNAKREILMEFNKCNDLESGDAANRSLCIVKLDTLLGKSLKYFGLKGSTTGDLLKSAKKVFNRDEYNAVWNAHKLRNRIVHENSAPGDKEFKIAVRYFKQAIKRL